MRVRRVLPLVVGAALAGLCVAPAAARQGGSERIVRYDVELEVADDGDLLVDERIEYDFGTNARRGILRSIPTRQRFDDTDDRLYPLEVGAVTASPGTPDDLQVEEDGGFTTLRIGDPDRTITGVHTYEIAYRVEGTLNGFPDHDELFWNAVGTEWSVPIEHASARVRAPGRVTEVACFAGPEGSRLPCSSATSDGASASFTTTGLAPGEALTVVTAFPTGLVPTPEPVLAERWSMTRAFSLTPVTVGTSSALLLAVVAGVGALLWRAGRDRRLVGGATEVAFAGDGADADERRVGLLERHETPVELVPPEGVRPGLVGTLVDETAHPLDVTATIVDLAVRGYLRIEEVPGSGWRAAADWQLVRLGDADPARLRAYEVLLLEGLFRDGDAVLLSALRTTFADRLGAVQDALYDDVVAHGWFAERPDRVRTRWAVIGMVALVLGVGLVVLAAATSRLGLVPVPLALGGLVLVAANRVMPRRTARGTGTLRRVLGFKRFIDESERDRARFAERAHLFTEYLPYAVVFGATERWARTFAGLEDQLPDTGWFISSRPFTVFAISDAMDGFAVTSAGSMTATPAASGSSGFGGGGFSGGGGGGGGGGSW